MSINLWGANIILYYHIRAYVHDFFCSFGLKIAVFGGKSRAYREIYVNLQRIIYYFQPAILWKL